MGVFDDVKNFTDQLRQRAQQTQFAQALRTPVSVPKPVAQVAQGLASFGQGFAEGPKQLGQGIGQAIVAPYSAYLQNKNNSTYQKLQNSLMQSSKIALQNKNIPGARMLATSAGQAGQTQAQNQVRYGQSLQDGIKKIIAGETRTGLTLVAGSAGLPAIAGNAAIGGGLNLAFGNKQQTPMQRFGQGAGESVKYAGFGTIAKPFEALAGSANVAGRALLGAGLNVGEQALYTKATENRGLTKGEFATNALLPILSEFGSSAIKKITMGAAKEIPLKVNKEGFSVDNNGYYHDPVSGKFVTGVKNIEVAKQNQIKAAGGGLMPKANDTLIEVAPNKYVLKSTLQTYASDIPNQKITVEPNGPQAGEKVGQEPNPTLDSNLVKFAKGIGKDKVPLQEPNIGNNIKGAVGEVKNIFSTGPGTQEVQDALRANRGSFDLNKDALTRESQPMVKEWDKLKPEDHIKFIKDIQTGTPQTNPQLQQLADQYRTRFNQDYELAKSLKPNLPFMENYFAQSGVWSNPQEAQNFYNKFATNSLGGKPGALEKRVFPTIQDGINAGLKLKETNPETIALTSRTQLLKAKMAQDFTDAQLAKGVPQEKITAVLDKYLGKGIQGSQTFQTIKQANASINSLQLGLSGFHVLGTGINASVSKAGMAVNDLLRGKPLDAVKHIAQTPTASLEYIFKGNQILNDVKKGTMTPDIANITGGGGRLRTPEIYKGVGFQDALNTIRKEGWQNKLKGGMQVIPATIETAAKPIMEWWVPRLKAGAAADLISNNLKMLGPNPTQEAINTVRARAIDSIDNRFGQLNMDNIFWNKTFKDLLSLSTRSPGWNIGTFRELGGGVKDLGNIKQLISGGGVSDRSAYTLALPVIVGMLGASYQFIKTGQSPQTIKDYFYPKTGQVDPKTGNPERVSFPTYAKDVYSFMTNPGQTVANKLSPIVSLGAQVAQNKDYYGKSIADPYANKLTQAGQMGKYIGSAILPFSLTGGSKRVDPSFTSKAENFMGITKAPGAITNPGQQDYYNARAELQNLNSKFSTVTKKMASGDLTQVEGQKQLQDLQNKINNATDVMNKAGDPNQGQTPHLGKIVSTLGGKYSYVDSSNIAHKNLTLTDAQKLLANDSKSAIAKLIVTDNLDAAKKLAQESGITVTNADVQKMAKKEAIRLVKAKQFDQAKALATKYQVILKNSDVQGGT